MYTNASNFLKGLVLTATFVLTGCPAEGGETDSDGSSGSTANPTSGATGGAAADCTAYCDGIMANCTGANAQYSSKESCMGACAVLPPGTAADMAGNTVGCRAYHSGAPAMMDAATHCVHGGPSGAAVCGSNCESFCSIAVATCPTEHPDEATCMATCMGFDDSESFDASDAAGNTLACRLYHLTVAATDAASAMTHCAHTVAASDPCM